MELLYNDDSTHVEIGAVEPIYKDKYLKNFKIDLDELNISKPRLEFWGDCNLGIDFVSISFPKNEDDKNNVKKYHLHCHRLFFKDIANVDCDDNGYTYIGVITTKGNVRYIIDEATSHYIMTNLYYWEKCNFK